MEDWMKDNVFCSYIESDVFVYDFLDRVLQDFKKFCEHKGKEFNREIAQEKLFDFIHEEMDYAIDDVLDDEFEEDEE